MPTVAPRSLSLKARVALLVITSLAVVVVVTAAVAYHEIEESLLGNLDLTLGSVAQAIRTNLDELSVPEVQEDVRSILGGTSPRSAFFFHIWNEDTGQVLLTSSGGRKAIESWAGQLDKKSLPQPQKDQFLNLNDGSHPYRAIWFRQPTKQGVVNVLIATSSRYAYHEMREYLRMLLILGSVTLLVAGIISIVFVPYALRPIRQAAERLHGVTHRNLGAEHLAGIKSPSELAPFVEAVRGMLERLNQAIQSQKRFVTDASHELRTPLAVAKSTIQTVRLKPRSNEEYQQALDELLEDVDRLDRLAGQLLDLARLEEIGNPSATEEVPLAPLLDDLARKYDTKAAMDGGKVICDCRRTSTTVRGNFAELNSLFGNLIDNAIKHGPRGGTVLVDFSIDEENGCRVTIRDEGGQIPPDQLKRMFERFYRVDGSRSRVTGGAGLGLAIAKEIALRLGGDIQIISSPTEGTIVSVSLPPAIIKA